VIDERSIAVVAASREGFEPVACTPVALPCWRLLIRVEVLARRDISPLEEFVLRAAAEADPKVGAVQRLLGLDEQTFEDALASVCGHEWARVDAGARLRLTDAGRGTLQTRTRERSEERAISMDFDGLLRRPLFLDAPLEPAQARSVGLLALPAWPPAPPDVLELADRAEALQALIRQAGDGRDQEVDLLAVKGVLRRDRIFREAVLVVFRSASGQIQVAPVIDGALSDEHEPALAAPEVWRMLRLASELRRGRRYEQILPMAARELHDPQLDAEATALRLQAGAPFLSEADEPDVEALRQRAADATRRLAVRRVMPQEHPRMLRLAVRSASQRLLIGVPAISPTALDGDTLADLRAMLGRGVKFTLVHATAPDVDLPGSLSALLERDGAQELRIRSMTTATLVRDGNLALRTLYPLLADRGRERPVRDERGWLVTDPGQVAALADEVLAQHPS
jgi:hypothetical protein